MPICWTAQQRRHVQLPLEILAKFARTQALLTGSRSIASETERPIREVRDGALLDVSQMNQQGVSQAYHFTFPIIITFAGSVFIFSFSSVSYSYLVTICNRGLGRIVWAIKKHSRVMLIQEFPCFRNTDKLCKSEAFGKPYVVSGGAIRGNVSVPVRLSLINLTSSKPSSPSLCCNSCKIY